jgi:hypothetical protein
MSTLQTKNYIQIQVKGTPLHIIGSVASNGSGAGNVMFPPAHGISLPQARAYADAMVRACNFVGTRTGQGRGKRGNPGQVVESNDLHSKRLLFFNDDQHFVTWTREKLQFDLYSFPVISVDGLTRDLPSTMQAVASIYAAIDEAVTIQKQTRRSIARSMRNEE